MGMCGAGGLLGGGGLLLFGGVLGSLAGKIGLELRDNLLLSFSGRFLSITVYYLLWRDYIWTQGLQFLRGHLFERG